MEEIEMFRCEACGGLHPVTDGEIVVIKLKKGKDCKITSVVKQTETTPQVRSYTIPTPEKHDASEENVVRGPLTEEEKKVEIIKNHPGIPDALKKRVQLPPRDVMSAFADPHKGPDMEARSSKTVREF